MEKEDKIEALATIFHRRSAKGFIDALTPANPRDAIYLSNLKAEAQKPKSKGTGDAELDSFNSFLSKE